MYKYLFDLLLMVPLALLGSFLVLSVVFKAVFAYEAFQDRRDQAGGMARWHIREEELFAFVLGCCSKQRKRQINEHLHGCLPCLSRWANSFARSGKSNAQQRK
jgi:hypothetical protein